MLEALVSFGANINIQDNEGNTPLHVAVINQSDMLKLVSIQSNY